VKRGHHQIVGGHYIPAVARDGDIVSIITWGAVLGMTQRFYEHFNNIAVVHLTDEMLTGGKTIDGFDRDALVADLQQFNTGQVP